MKNSYDDGQNLVHALLVCNLRVLLGVDEEDGGHEVLVVIPHDQGRVRPHNILNWLNV